MPLTHDRADELLKKIKDLQDKKGIQWQSVAGMDRRIVYIPFTPAQDIAEDGKQTMRETKEEERDALMLRSFAKAMHGIMEKGEPQPAAAEMKAALDGDGKLDDTNLMQVFKAIKDEDVKRGILEKTAAKTPIIIQRGVPLPADFQINENDSIEIAAHGQDNEDFIQNAGVNKNAQQVLAGMQDDFGDQMPNIRKIKLTSCGSGGAFFNSFIAEAAASCSLSGDTKIDGYNGEAFMIPKIEHALDHLDKGNRFISSADDLKVLRELKKQKITDQQSLDIALVNALVNAADDGGYQSEEEDENIASAEEDLAPDLVQEAEEAAALGEPEHVDPNDICAQSQKLENTTSKIENHTFDSRKFKRASAEGSRKSETIKTVRDSLTSSSSSSSSASPRHVTGGSSSSNAPPPLSPSSSPSPPAPSSQRKKMN